MGEKLRYYLLIACFLFAWAVPAQVRMVSKPMVTEFRSPKGLLLGYTDAPGLQLDSIPDALKEWMAGWEQEGVCAAQFRTQQAVSPLVTAAWNQISPYNDSVPTLSTGKQAATGCVATAMAQLMHFWKYPQQGMDTSISYKWARAAGDTIVLQHDFSKSFYDWSKMKNVLLGADADGRAEIGRLMRDCGYSVSSKYGSTTFAGNTASARALKTYFGYDKTINIMHHACLLDADWDSLIKAELDEGRPVYFAGQTATKSGHAFICDGYNEDGYFHFNWGWGGKSNGYFLLQSLNPKSQGAGGSGNDSTGYNWGQVVVIGIQPENDNTYTARPVVSADSCLFSRDFNNVSATVYKLYNRGCTKITNGYIGLLLQDSVGQTVLTLDSLKFTLSGGYYFTALKKLEGIVPPDLEGKYKVVLAYRLPNTWHNHAWHTIYKLGGGVYETGISLSPKTRKRVENGKVWILCPNGDVFAPDGKKYRN